MSDHAPDEPLAPDRNRNVIVSHAGRATRPYLGSLVCPALVETNELRLAADMALHRREKLRPGSSRPQLQESVQCIQHEVVVMRWASRRRTWAAVPKDADIVAAMNRPIGQALSPGYSLGQTACPG